MHYWSFELLAKRSANLVSNIFEDYSVLSKEKYALCPHLHPNVANLTYQETLFQNDAPVPTKPEEKIAHQAVNS